MKWPVQTPMGATCGESRQRRNATCILSLAKQCAAVFYDNLIAQGAVFSIVLSGHEIIWDSASDELAVPVVGGTYLLANMR